MTVESPDARHGRTSLSGASPARTEGGKEMEKMSMDLPLLLKRTLRPAWRRAANRYPRLMVARQRMNQALAPTLKHRNVRPENLIWIFGTGRSGSTWLMRMMGENPRTLLWNEPMVGQLFGRYYIGIGKEHLQRPHFILSEARREVWIKSIRNFVLEGARFVVPAALGPRPYVVIKEPNGSLGAPLLMEALPESRMIVLVRDPRDVTASTLDAAREGGWLHAWVDENKTAWRQNALADRDPNTFVRMNATVYKRQLGNAKRAYDAHKGPKVLVRYEDLRADTLGEMKRIYSVLGIPADEEKLARAVEKQSWKNISDEKKGEGKFYRKGSAGSWKEDLTPKQVRIVERITAPLLQEFYPD